jgi:phosphopantothenoylcysteine decarboxylase/phosphopantothenate--cysteine ligase
MSALQKNILLGVTGSIAAYKSPDLLRLLQQEGANIQVILTQQGSRFITPLTLQALSHQRVYTDLEDQKNLDWGMDHINLARWADRILIAPASANIIAKLAHGLGDDLLTTTCLASTAPVTLVPAMNPVMWQQAATQSNVTILKSRGIEFLGPVVGDHACGEKGLGRMLEPVDIVTHLTTSSANCLLKNVHVLITAGPTHEPIDPIRFISNKSSGQMGYALAQAALRQGAKVTLISGPTTLIPPDGVTFISVVTAQEMYQAVLQIIETQDLFFSAAAVSDFHCVQYLNQKIKKPKNTDTFTLEFKCNLDIIASIKAKYPSIFCVGFALETENLIENAIQKMQIKSLDLIIANLNSSDYGIGKENNAASLIDKKLAITNFPCENKNSLAEKLVAHIATQFYSSLQEVT